MKDKFYCIVALLAGIVLSGTICSANAQDQHRCEGDPKADFTAPVLGREVLFFEPWVILDGVPVDYSVLLALDTGCIASITLLKDSSSSLTHRSSKGVLLVTTFQEKHHLMVLDGQFDAFLATQQLPSQFSQRELKNKNRLLVQEWNRRCDDVTGYDPDIYRFRINYQAHTKYGEEVEYKLYMYLQYLKFKNWL